MDKAPQQTKEQSPALRTLMELFDIDATVAILVIAATLFIIAGGIAVFMRSAPPSTVTITTGPEGSTFHQNALKYAAYLEKNGVKARVLTSNGSLENLQRLVDPKAHVDVGIVQAGLTAEPMEQLRSLGSISFQPLFVFYRGKPLELISEFKGKSVAVGAIGSGTRNFALQVLAANGIVEGGSTRLIDLDADDAARELEAGHLDAAFVMSESASHNILHRLLRLSTIHLMSFRQANAYSRKIEHLNVLDLPEGALDLGLNIPTHDVSLLGPMVELVATKNLHPALSDLLVEAATEVHNRPGIFQHRGQFPQPIEHVIKLSEDAVRFYKSGKTFLYRYLPFWLASLMSRMLVVFLPIAVLLVPAIRSVPGFFRWRVQIKIRRRYRELLALEREFLHEQDSSRLPLHHRHLDRIHLVVSRMRVPAAYADQYYSLRSHINDVRTLMSQPPPGENLSREIS